MSYSHINFKITNCNATLCGNYCLTYMNIFKTIFALLIFPFVTYGQQAYSPNNNPVQFIQAFEQQPAKASFEQTRIKISNESNRNADIIGFLMSTLPELRHQDISLQLSHFRVSRMGFHYSFIQAYKGIPIFGATVQLNTNNEHVVLSLFNHCYNTQNWDADVFKANQSLGKAYWFVGPNNPIAGYAKFQGEYQLLLDIYGDILIRKEAKFNYMLDDTTATGKVFQPDPLSSQSVIYGQDGTYQHFNDSDYALLNDQRKQVTFPVVYENDSFRLVNNYVKIVDRETPSIRPAVSKTPSFEFLRSKPGFKDVMVLYHVTSTQQYFQYLKFNELNNYQIKADAHSSTSDQSFFAFGADSSLNFGTGGVPDAEDADVIVHEYTHALSWFINPSPNMSIERRAIEEGICDVIAAVQSKKYTDFNWRRLFNFDGPNPVASGVSGFWNGRNGNSPKKYADRSNNSYRDCEIWTSTILDICNEIGNDSAVILMLESIYAMSENTTMPQAAVLYMQADSILFDKYFSWKIGRLFNERGLGDFKTSVQSTEALKRMVTLKNTAAFAVGEGDAVLDLGMITDATIEVFDAMGQKVLTANNVNNAFQFNQDMFSSGFYIVTVSSSQTGSLSFKLIKSH